MITAEQLAARTPDLHDSVLLSIRILWPEGVAELKFRSSAGLVGVSVAQVTFVECPRRLPWGRSDAVNDVAFSVGPSGSAVRVTVEMQSGDCVVVDGATVGVERAKEVH